MNPKLTKAELAATVALACDMPKEHASRAVDTALESIVHALAQGEDVRITGFGTFSTRMRPQRSVRNPQTGQPVTVPAARSVRFVTGNMLRTAVRQR